MTQQLHQSGFVTIIGNPNVGKSTLMNAMVGEKLSIVTSKMQTTRHRIKGIVSGDDYQVVFSDTPGILDPKYKLHESMMTAVVSSLEDADIVLLMTDIYEKGYSSDMLKKIRRLRAPVMVLVNKVDEAKEDVVKEKIEYWETRMKGCKVIPLSALNGFNTDVLMKEIIALLPESPPYFPKEDLTDSSERFFVAEIIREKILQQYRKEVPYAVEVKVEEFKEEEKLTRIRAVIYVERDSQKGIIIGDKGKAIKQVGVNARKDIEKLLDKQVFLELFVKVSKDWRSKDRILKRFGY